MSRLVIPIASQTLWSTGHVRLWADLDLLLSYTAGTWKMEKFRVDTGTDLTTFPADLAKQLNVPMPAKAASGVRHVQTGQEIRSGNPSIPNRRDGPDRVHHTLFLSGRPE